MRFKSTIRTILAAAAFLAAGASGSFSHDHWTTVLGRFVDERGLVDYEGLSHDRALFDEYVRSIETVGPESNPELFPSRADAMAYYLNAYNALVFQGVLSRGPEQESVWSGVISGLNFFARMSITVDGRSTNLRALENKIIRERFQDPRIHAALNCASIGCPRLPAKAFEPATLEQELDAAMTEFVNEQRHCAVDPEREEVTLSKIFDWFESDFLDYERRMGNTDPGIVDYLNRYRAADRRIPRSYEVRYFKYDKRINKQ